VQLDVETGSAQVLDDRIGDGRAFVAADGNFHGYCPE
jgi:hypothetical protein